MIGLRFRLNLNFDEFWWGCCTIDRNFHLFPIFRPHMQGTSQPQRTDMLGLSIVIPCFNEEPGLAELVRRCSESAALAVGDNYELILVDDGSTDGTWNAITSHIGRRPNIVAMKLSRNYGHQIALTAGLSAVRGRVVFVIDADLQDPPELLREMLQKMSESAADVV